MEEELQKTILHEYYGLCNSIQTSILPKETKGCRLQQMGDFRQTDSCRL